MLRLLRTGIAQGYILRPLTFLLCIDDLTDVSPSDLFILFADDTTCLTAPNRLHRVCNCFRDKFSAN